MLFKATCRAAGIIVLAAAAAACAPSHDGLHSTLWVQTSSEYRALVLQTYGAAAEKLDAALADSAWTAALEQTGQFSSLPPAVILDVDETVLDSSRFQGELIRRNRVFAPGLWDEWISRARAPAVPGALAFVKEARGKGITILYVTNRSCAQRTLNGSACPQKEDTARNLEKLGFPRPSSADQLLLRTKESGWAREKSSRRQRLAASFRILMLVGDDLGDFIPGIDGDGMAPLQRLEAMRQYEGYWGTKWFMLPNPIYGSWLNVLGPRRWQFVEGL